MNSDRIEIWFLIGMLPVGGAERTLVDLANNIDKEDFSVTVWTMMDDGELIEDLSDDVKYRTLSASSKWDLRAPLRFISAVRSEQPDIVNSFLFFDNILARFAGKLVKVPSIITGVRAVPNNPKIHRSILDKKTQSWSDLIVSNSEAGAEYSISRGASPEKVRVIRNGRDIERYADGYAPPDLFDSLSLDSNAPIVGTVGRLIERKGHYDLLNAWPTVLESHLDAQLLLVGDGLEREGLEKRARELGCADSVIFAGQRDDVPDLLDAMDVFVFPSHYEGLPGALMEAMIAGLPIVATPVDGNSELIDDGVTGLFVPPHDSQAIAERLKEVLADPGLRAEFGAAASDYARKEFAVEKMVTEFENLYKNLMVDD